MRIGIRKNPTRPPTDEEMLERSLDQVKAKKEPVKAAGRGKVRKVRKGIYRSDSLVVVRATVTLNPAKKGVEIRFPTGIDPTHSSQLREHEFHFAKFSNGRYDPRWYAKHTPDRELWVMWFMKSYNDAVIDVKPPDQDPPATPAVKPKRIKIESIHIVNKPPTKPAVRLQLFKIQ
jgi:hypothetical protein